MEPDAPESPQREPVELKKPVKEEYVEKCFHYSGAGEDQTNAAIGFTGSWPHPNAKKWGTHYRKRATPSTTRGLRQPSTTLIGAPRPRLPWNQPIKCDFQFNREMTKMREEKRKREHKAIKSGATQKVAPTPTPTHTVADAVADLTLRP